MRRIELSAESASHFALCAHTPITGTSIKYAWVIFSKLPDGIHAGAGEAGKCIYEAVEGKKLEGISLAAWWEQCVDFTPFA